MVHRGQHANSRRPKGILADAGKLRPRVGLARDAARVFVLRVPMRGLQSRTETIPERKRVGAILAMTDWTARAIELEEAKAAMLAAKKRIKSEVEREALRKARETVADRVAEVEYDFARRLAMAVAEGMPQDTIRKEVLRTNDWPTWRKWRDMAQIEPQRVSVAKAKEVTRQANAATIFDRDALTLTVRKDQNGKTLETPVVYDLTTVRRIGPSRDMWGALPDDEALDEAVRREAGQPYFRYLSNEIDRLISSGEVADPRENG